MPLNASQVQQVIYDLNFLAEQAERQGRILQAHERRKIIYVLQESSEQLDRESATT